MFDIQDFLQTHQPKNGRFFTIAIDGRGGSGKSLFTELLKTKLPGFVVLNGDDYFEPVDDPIVFGAFNDERFIQDVINPLKTEDSFIYRPYDWETKQASEQALTITKGFCLERDFLTHSLSLTSSWWRADRLLVFVTLDGCLSPQCGHLCTDTLYSRVKGRGFFGKECFLGHVEVLPR